MKVPKAVGNEEIKYQFDRIREKIQFSGPLRKINIDIA
jgi:hypothetical protein